MSAKSWERYTPVPPITSSQTPDEKKMSSRKAAKPSQSSDLNISGDAAVFSKPPVLRRQSSVTTRTTAAAGSEKPCPEAGVKADCPQVETQVNADAEKRVVPEATDAAECELIRRHDENVVMTNDAYSSEVNEDANSLAMSENAADAAGDGDEDSDEDDDQSHNASVSFSLL